MLGQRRDVLAPVAERRDLDREDAEPEEQVLAELARGHQLAERPVGRGQEPDVDRPGPGISHGRHLAMLDRPEQLDLDRRRDVADLVQQHGPPVGQLEQALAVLTAPVNEPRTWPKSSRSISPELSAARQTGRKGPLRRVLWRWMARATSSLPVPLSPVISTGTSVGATRAICLKSSCIAGDWPISASRAAALGRRPALHGRVRPCRPPRDSSARLTDRGGLIEVEGLDQVIERSSLHGPDGGLEVAERGDDDDRRRADQLAKLPDGREAVDPRQANVEHDGIGGVLPRSRIPSSAEEASSTSWPRSPRNSRNAQQMLGLVVDDQDATHGFRPASIPAGFAGRLRRNRVHAPSRVQVKVPDAPRPLAWPGQARAPRLPACS